MRTRPRWPLLAALLLVIAMVSATLTSSAAANGADDRDHPSLRHGGDHDDDDGDIDVVLTLLHSNDGESALFETEASDEQLYGGMAPFATVVEQLKREATRGRPPVPGAKRVELLVSSGDNYLAGAAFQASLDNGVPYYDAIGMRLIGYDASAIGNHEFDFGPDVFRDFVRSLGRRSFPFVSANLDFSGEPDLQALVDSGRIADSIVVRTRGERFGIVGATTEALATISSPRNVVVDGVALAAQAEVDALLDRGVEKIIFISHLQSIQEDLALLAELTGIDVAVAGGGDELLANPDDLLVPGDEASVFAGYPVEATDAEGDTVPVVTTSGGYRYVGKLKVAFDDDGDVVEVFDDSGPVRVTTGADNPDAVRPDRRVQQRVVDPVAAFVDELATTPAGMTEAPLDSRRGVAAAGGGGVVVTTRGERVSETNVGDLATDAYVASATELAPSFGVAPPDVAITNGGGIRRPDDVLFPAATPGSPATVSRLDVSDQFPFPNFLTISEDVPVATLKGLLENGVARVENVDGRFAHVSGLVYQWDSTRTAEVRDLMTCAPISPGDRVTYIALDPGNDGVGLTVLYDESMGGWQVDENATTVGIASIDFLSLGGGDCYDFGGAATTVLGVQYGQAVEEFITDDLAGLITAADYPFEGTNRIQQVG